MQKGNHMNQLQQEEFLILLELDRILKRHNIPYYLYGGTLLGAARHQGFIPWDDDIDIVLTREHFEAIETILSDPANISNGFHYQSAKTTKYFNAAFSKLRSDAMYIKEAIPKTQVGNYGPWVDLFVYDKIPDNAELRLKQYNQVTKYNRIIKFFTTMQAQKDKSGIGNSFKNIIRIMNETCYKLYFFMPYLYKKRRYYMTMYNDEDTEYSSDLGYLFYKDYDHYSSTFINNTYLTGDNTLTFEGSSFPVPSNVDVVLRTLYGDYMILPDEGDRKIHKIINGFVD